MYLLYFFKLLLCSNIQEISITKSGMDRLSIRNTTSLLGTSGPIRYLILVLFPMFPRHYGTH